MTSGTCPEEKAELDQERTTSSSVRRGGARACCSAASDGISVRLSAMNFVVTGCGRSGTTFLAKLLSNLNVPCGHEQVFTPRTRMTPREFSSDASWMAVPFLESLAPDCPVVHLTRAPSLVAASFVRIGFFSPDHDRYWRPAVRWNPLRQKPEGREYIAFLRRHSPQTFYELRALDRALYHWWDWNSRILAQSHARPYVHLRISDVAPAAIARVLEVLDEPRSGDQIRRALRSLPTDVNTRGLSTGGALIAASDISLPSDVAELASRFGY